MIPLFDTPFSVTDSVWLTGFLSLDFLLPVGLNGLFALNSFSGFCSVYMAGLLSLYSLAIVIFRWLNCGHSMATAGRHSLMAVLVFSAASLVCLARLLTLDGRGLLDLSVSFVVTFVAWCSRLYHGPFIIRRWLDLDLNKAHCCH